MDAIPLDRDWIVRGLSKFTDLTLDVYLVKIYPDRSYGYPCLESKKGLRAWLKHLLPDAQLVTEDDSPSWYMVGISRDGEFPDLSRYGDWSRAVAVREIRAGVEATAPAQRQSVESADAPAVQDEGAGAERGLVVRYVNGQFVMVAGGSEELDEEVMEDAPSRVQENNGEVKEAHEENVE